jgi:hypothetical protein
VDNPPACLAERTARQDAAAAGVLFLVPDDEPDAPDEPEELEEADVVEPVSDFFDSVLVEPASFPDDDAAAGSADDFSELPEPARLSVR